MKPRYYPRAVAQGSAVFTVGGLTDDGQVLDLTVPGCLIDCPLSPKMGDSLTLCLDLPQVGATFHVALGVVRWVQWSRFGVEFSRWTNTSGGATTPLSTRSFTSRQPSHARPDQKSDSRQPGPVNWHLMNTGCRPPTTQSQRRWPAAVHASRRGGDAEASSSAWRVL